MYAEGSAMEVIALKCCTVLSILLLQKPHHNSKVKENLLCLEKRLKDVRSLLEEGRALQRHIPMQVSSL